MLELSLDEKIAFVQALMEYLAHTQREIDVVDGLAGNQLDDLIVQLKGEIGPSGKSYVETLERQVRYEA